MVDNTRHYKSAYLNIIDKLSSTDYVVNKIAEAEQFYPEEVEELKAKYSKVIEQRKQWRTEANAAYERYVAEVTRIKQAQ